MLMSAPVNEVWIPPYPAERTYTCPGCSKGVRAVRIGDSCSYLIEHPTEKKDQGRSQEGEGKCKYKRRYLDQVVGIPASQGKDR